MAVAFSTHAAATPTTNSSITRTITVSGTNPVLVCGIALDSTTITVSSVTWSLGSGTAIEVKALRQSTCFTSVWVIPAPSAGSGTVTVNLSSSTAVQLDVALFTGADQTTPCPTGDAVSFNNTGGNSSNPPAQTPSNLTANDASFGAAGNTIAGTPNSAAPNQLYLDTSTNVNLMTGYATGTTGITFAYTLDDPTSTLVAVRIAAGGGGGSRTVLNTRSNPLGVRVGMGWRMPG